MSNFKVINAPKQTTTTAAGLSAALAASQPGEVITVTEAGDPINLTLSDFERSGYGVTVVLPLDQLIYFHATSGTHGVNFIGGRFAADIVRGSITSTNNGIRVNEGCSRIGVFGAIFDRNNNGVQASRIFDLKVSTCLFDICRADGVNARGGSRFEVSNNNMLGGAKGEKFCYFSDGTAPIEGTDRDTCEAAGGIWQDTSHNDRGQFRSVIGDPLTDVTIRDNVSVGEWQGWVDLTRADLRHPDGVVRVEVTGNQLTEDSNWGITWRGSHILIADNTCVPPDGLDANLRIDIQRRGDEPTFIRGGRNVAPIVSAPEGIDLESSDINGDEVDPPEPPRIALPAWAPEVTLPDAPVQDQPPQHVSGGGLRWFNSPALPEVGTALSINRGLWANALNGSWEFRWLVDDELVAGETAQVYVVKAADAGKKIEVESRGTNPSGTGDWHTYPSVTAAAATKPVLTLAWMGQSELEQCMSNASTYRKITNPTLLAENLTLLYDGSGAGDTVASTELIPITFANADVQNPGMIGFANMLHTIYPNTDIKLVDLAVQGTGLRALFDDAQPSRSWAVFEAVVTEARTEFGEIDIVLQNWWNATSATLKTFPEAYAPGIMGQRWNGGAFAIGDTADDGSGSGVVDHMLWDITGANRGLFSVADTKYSIAGPGPYTNVTSSNPDEGANFSVVTSTMGQLDRPARDRLAEFMADSRVQTFGAGYGISTHVCKFGDDGEPSGTGNTHPAQFSPDGQVLFAMHNAVAFAQANGAEIYTPKISGYEAAPDGSYVDILVDLPNGGTLETIRTQRDEAPPDPQPPHWNEVVGFEIRRTGDTDADRQPLWSDSSRALAYRGSAFIQDTGSGFPRRGRVRITPVEPFADGDAVEYLRGGAGAILLRERDSLAQLYKDMLIERVAALAIPDQGYEYPGIPVDPQPPTIVISLDPVDPVDPVDPPEEHDFTVTTVTGGVDVAWDGEPVDFTITPTAGGVTIEWEN